MLIELCEGAYANDRYTTAEVKAVMKIIAPALSTATPLFKLVGSNRRGGKADYGDIDLIVTNTSLQIVKDCVAKVLDITSTPRQGEKVMSLVIDYKGKELQLEISLVERDTFGAASIGATGGNEFNIALRSIAKRKGFLLNNYGLFDRDSNRLIAGKTENEVFKALGLKFIPPNKRDVTVSQAWDLLRQYKLNESMDEIADLLAYGVVGLQHSGQIRQDLRNAADKIKSGATKAKAGFNWAKGRGKKIARSNAVKKGLAHTRSAARKLTKHGKKAGRSASKAVTAAGHRTVTVTRDQLKRIPPAASKAARITGNAARRLTGRGHNPPRLGNESLSQQLTNALIALSE